MSFTSYPNSVHQIEIEAIQRRIDAILGIPIPSSKPKTTIQTKKEFENTTSYKSVMTNDRVMISHDSAHLFVGENRKNLETTGKKSGCRISFGNRSSWNNRKWPHILWLKGTLESIAKAKLLIEEICCLDRASGLHEIAQMSSEYHETCPLTPGLQKVHEEQMKTAAPSPTGICGESGLWHAPVEFSAAQMRGSATMSAGYFDDNGVWHAPTLELLEGQTVEDAIMSIGYFDDTGLWHAPAAAPRSPEGRASETAAPSIGCFDNTGLWHAPNPESTEGQTDKESEMGDAYRTTYRRNLRYGQHKEYGKNLEYGQRKEPGKSAEYGQADKHRQGLRSAYGWGYGQKKQLQKASRQSLIHNKHSRASASCPTEFSSSFTEPPQLPAASNFENGDLKLSSKQRRKRNRAAKVAQSYEAKGMSGPTHQ